MALARRSRRLMRQKRSGFVARGGLWVVAQIPLLFLMFVIPPRFGTGHFVPTEPFQMAGVVVTVLGVMLIVRGFINLGDALTPFPRPLAEATLHRQGAYRWMRHPIYTGVMLAAFGWALWWLSAAGALCALALAVFFDRKAAHEETWLRKRYKNYRDYARRVKKFIPGLY